MFDVVVNLATEKEVTSAGIGGFEQGCFDGADLRRRAPSTLTLSTSGRSFPLRHMTRESVFEFQCLGYFSDVVPMLLPPRPRRGRLLNLRSLGLCYHAISF
jgi:hypothetical protein